MKKLKEKLTSRKFLVTLIGVGCGIACLFGADGETVKLVGGALLTLVPTVVYIIIEGKIDESSVKRLASALSDALDVVSGKEEKSLPDSSLAEENKEESTDGTGEN